MVQDLGGNQQESYKGAMFKKVGDTKADTGNIVRDMSPQPTPEHGDAGGSFLPNLILDTVMEYVPNPLYLNLLLL